MRKLHHCISIANLPVVTELAQHVSSAQRQLLFVVATAVKEFIASPHDLLGSTIFVVATTSSSQPLCELQDNMFCLFAR